MKATLMRLCALSSALFVLAGCGSGGIPPLGTTTTTPSTVVYSGWSFVGTDTDTASEGNGVTLAMDGVMAVDGTKVTFKDGFTTLTSGKAGRFNVCQSAALQIPGGGGFSGTFSATDLNLAGSTNKYASAPGGTIDPAVTATIQGLFAADKQSLISGSVTLSGYCNETFGLTKAVKIAPVNGTFKGTITPQVAGGIATDVTLVLKQSTTTDAIGGAFPLTATVTYGNAQCTPLTANIALIEGSHVEMYDHINPATSTQTSGLVFTASPDGSTLTAAQWGNGPCVPSGDPNIPYMQTATGTLTKQ